MVYRLQLTYHEIMDILNVKNIAGSTIGYTMAIGIYEVIEFSLMVNNGLY